MKRFLVVALALVALAGCNTARTAYNRDRSQSWVCVPNTAPQPPIRNAPPLTVVEGAAAK